MCSSLPFLEMQPDFWMHSVGEHPIPSTQAHKLPELCAGTACKTKVPQINQVVLLASWKERGGPGQELLLLSLFLNTWKTLSYYGGEDHIST